VKTGLTVARRSCLLRAARARLKQLESDYESLSTRGTLGHEANVLLDELGCISSAIRWLWVQPADDEDGR